MPGPGAGQVGVAGRGTGFSTLCSRRSGLGDSCPKVHIYTVQSTLHVMHYIHVCVCCTMLYTCTSFSFGDDAAMNLVQDLAQLDPLSGGQSRHLLPSLRSTHPAPHIDIIHVYAVVIGTMYMYIHLDI